MMAMMDVQEQSYRLRYEAFSKFAGEASCACSFEALGQVIRRNLKFLLTSYFARFYFQGNGRVVVFQVFRGELEVLEHQQVPMLPAEAQVLEQGVPTRFTSEDLPELPLMAGLAQPALHEKVEEFHVIPILLSKARYVILSIATRRGRNLSNIDYHFARLTSEFLEHKVFELLLKERISHQNVELTAANEEIAEQNRQISRIVDNQEEIIARRTEELRRRTDRLIEFSHMNSHQVRAALCRILGLIQIIESEEDELEIPHLLSLLKHSSEELDGHVREIAVMLYEEGYTLPEQKR